MSFLNQSLFQFIYGLSRRNFFLDGFAVFCAQDLPYFLVLIFFVMVFYEKSRRGKWYLFCEAALAIILSRGLITEGIHFFYHYPRPFDVLGFTPLINAAGPSFPSGHAAWFFALATVVFFRNRKQGLWFFIGALVIVIARIYVGVHWPFDVAAGAVIGICSALFIHWLLRDSRRKLFSDAIAVPDHSQE